MSLEKIAFGTLLVGKSSWKEKCSGKTSFWKSSFVKNSKRQHLNLIERAQNGHESLECYL